jgi:DNA helicase-2/ATP-dependent DNA helicase PcrA
LFRDHPEVLKKYQEHFSYILVDEYQDTNSAQHLIVRQLSEIRRRICVVGDDAQSIYSFRGANIDNVLQLKTVYPDLRIFKLEQNYRSTQNIVDAANSLIHKNKGQIPKTVYSEKEKGSKVALASTYSDYEEAYTVAFKIDELRMGGGRYSYADFAVLYRTNAQSRTLEEALRKRNIPYKIYGGLSFYQRKEVKDIIAYLRLVVNPHDEEALKRTINYPARGIGEATLEKLTVAASENNASLWAVLERPDLYALQLTGGTLKKLAAFKEMIDEFIRQNEVLQADEMTSFVIKKSGVAGELLQDRSVEGLGRQENMEELLTGIAEYIDVQREEGRERITLADFLSEVSLLTDQDNDKAENANRVTLMTVHAAKGLEFKNVFIVGLEEDLFPMLMSKDSVKAIEEERRLFYVAITRAGENCILTYARSRFRNGRSNLCSPSRFIKDIDPKYLHAPGEDTRESAFAKREQTRAPAFASPFRQPQATEPAAPALPEQTELPAGVSELKAGMKVRHDRFGAGEIMAIEGIGGNIRATVQFANFGQKQLLLKFARLTIIK